MANTRLSPDEARQILLRQMERPASGPKPAVGRDGWRVRVQSYAPGETVLLADALSSGLSLVVQGQLAVYTDRRRDNRPLVVLTPGRTFGRATPTLCPARATLRALTPCEIWFLERAATQVDSGRPEAQTARRTGKWRRLGPALAIVLAAAALLALPITRSALAVISVGLGSWCHQKGAEWCAEGTWKVAGLLAPRDAAPSLGLGTLAFRQGDLAGAERAFERARQADPTCSAAYNNLGVVYHRRGEYEQAVAAFEQALVLEPGSASSEQNLGDSLLALRAYGQAIAHYRVALSLREPEAQTLANMAVAQYQAGESAEAEKTLQQALAKACDEHVRDQIGRSLSALQGVTGDGETP